MLELINRFLISIDACQLSYQEYDRILDTINVNKIEAIKLLRTYTKKKEYFFLQFRPGKFQDFLLAHGIDSLSDDVTTLGLKDAKEVIDFIVDNWAARNIK